MEDELIGLPADTLALLEQFHAEQLKKLEEEEVEEDWQLSQFWYCRETAERLVAEACRVLGEDGGVVACISSPTLIASFHHREEYKSGRIQVRVFEFDDRFGRRYPAEFVQYDYRQPLAVADQLKDTFDVVIADPPFLADECLVKTAQTVKLIAKKNAKLLLCTGAIMEEMAGRLLGMKRCVFAPKHANNLANDFACFANYEAETLKHP